MKKLKKAKVARPKDMLMEQKSSEKEKDTKRNGPTKSKN